MAEHQTLSSVSSVSEVAIKVEPLSANHYIAQSELRMDIDRCRTSPPLVNCPANIQTNMRSFDQSYPVYSSMGNFELQNYLYHGYNNPYYSWSSLPSLIDPNSSATTTTCLSQIPRTATADNYVHPVAYFEALIDDAAARYEKTAQFFKSMHAYSEKCEVYIKFLQYLSDDLAKPPPTLQAETYRRLAKLRRNICCLELKLVERRDLATNSSSKSLEHHSTAVKGEDKAAVLTSAVVAEADTASSRKLYAHAKASAIGSQATPKSEVNSSIGDVPLGISLLRPKRKCMFCNGVHWSQLCVSLPTLQLRQSFFRAHQLCTLCGKKHVGICLSYNTTCRWPQCGSQYSHHSSLCPNVEYPITMRHTETYRIASLEKGEALEQVSQPTTDVLNRTSLSKKRSLVNSEQPSPKRSC